MAVKNAVLALRQHMQHHIIGQPKLVDRMLICLLADGHLLVEGAPGLAKTKAINALAQGLEGDFKRIQFTPDLLPGDITGTDIYRPQTQTFDFQPGPIFHHLILADEINRAPAKVQSALLEAMAERQITVGGQTRPLPQLFLVMATQNPIEQEGTYPLPEAQLDRFLFKLDVQRPDTGTLERILTERRAGEPPELEAKATAEDLAALYEAVDAIHLPRAVARWIARLVAATHTDAPSAPEAVSQRISSGEGGWGSASRTAAPARGASDRRNAGGSEPDSTSSNTSS